MRMFPLSFRQQPVPGLTHLQTRNTHSYFVCRTVNLIDWRVGPLFTLSLPIKGTAAARGCRSIQSELSSGPMITQRQIETYAAEVAREFRPLKIILFGSYAYGSPTEDSDVDLLVVMPKNDSGVRNRERALAIRSAIPKPFPLDLLVRDPEDIAWRLEEGDCFLQDVFSKGRVLYETTHN